MWPAGDSGTFVGRRAEVHALRCVVDDAFRYGRGRAILVDGEPGIGRSALLAYGLGGAVERGADLGWAYADELSTRFPLRLMLDCLHGPTAPGPAEPILLAVERLVGQVERRCARGPLVLVANHLQWADEVSLLLWYRLVPLTERLPLILAGAHRPVPHRPELALLRQAVERTGGLVISLGPLHPDEAAELARGVPDPELVAGAAGNPRYLREAAGSYPHVSAAIDRHLGFLTPGTATVLRAAALLGREVAVADLAALLDGPVGEPLAEAEAAGIVERSGDRLTFRHPLVRRALYDAIPTGVRIDLHRHAARVLAGTGAEPEYVAAHLAHVPVADAWSAGWLVGHGQVLARRVPELARELFDRALAAGAPGDPGWEALAGMQAEHLARLGADPTPLARQVLAAGTDPAVRARMAWLLGVPLLRAGRTGAVRDVVRQGTGGPEPWRSRLGALGAVATAYASGESPATGRVARAALAAAEKSGDPYAVGYGLLALATVAQVRRDQPGRLRYLDQALEVLPGDEDLLAHRVYALHLLDRFDEAERVPVRGVPAAVLAYCTGRWDDALAALAEVPRSPVGEGLAALIACHRDDRAGAVARLDTVPAGEERDSGFLLTARALLAERDGAPERARDVLAVILSTRYARQERHMLLPHLVRIALAAGDAATAKAALGAAEADAAAHRSGPRVAAVSYCRGLLAADTGPLRAAIAHFEGVRRLVDLAQAREELAVAHAVAGHTAPARVAGNAAKEGYARLGATWALRRTDARLRAHGVRLGPRGPRRAPTCGGWAALSPTEVTIARLVARGRSNPDIAAELLLSRRTVQSHVSSILAKLHLRTRVEIAREAQRHL